MAERWIVDDEVSERYPIYTRGNVGEVFPEPVAPFAATVAITPYAEPGWRDAYARSGLFDHEEFAEDNNEIIAILGGYCYLNASIVRIMGVRLPGMTPEMVDLALFGEQPGVPAYEPHPDDESDEKAASSFEWMIGIMTTSELPELQADRARTVALRDARPDYSTMSNEELLALARDLYRDNFRHLFAQHIFISNATQIPLGIIGQICEAVGDPSLAMRLVAGLGDVESAAPSWAMWELGRRVAQSDILTSEFDAGVDGLLDRLEAHRGSGEVDTFLGELAAFLREFGSRGPNEWDLASATWETKPELALAAIERMRLMDDADAPDRHHERRVADRDEVSRLVAEKLVDQPEMKEQFEQAVAAAKVYFPGRERSKTNAIRMTHEARLPMQELGRRMVDEGYFDRMEDFAMITDPEYDAFLADPESFRDKVADRRARYEELADLDPPFVFKGEQAPPHTWNRRDDRGIEPAGPGDVLTGIPGCPGRATGRARVVLDPLDPTALEPGDVLVAPITDPAWTPLFVPAAAVVVDVGAQLSHAIIVSRELGIPCVVSVTGGTERIPDGALVTVDGDTGTVTIEPEG